MNGTKAAIRAGYSENSARFQASKLLTNSNISEHLEKKLRALIDKQEVEISEVLKELKTIGFSNITDYLEFKDSGVKLKDSKKIDIKKLKAIESVMVKEYETGTHKELKLHSKIAALSRLLDYLELKEEEKVENKLEIEIITRRIG